MIATYINLHSSQALWDLTNCFSFVSLGRLCVYVSAMQCKYAWKPPASDDDLYTSIMPLKQNASHSHQHNNNATSASSWWSWRCIVYVIVCWIMRIGGPHSLFVFHCRCCCNCISDLDDTKIVMVCIGRGSRTMKMYFKIIIMKK